jgi:predicted transcriptional regulator
MKLVLFWVFILAFVVLFAVTMLGVTQKITIPAWILGELVTSVLVALAGAVITLFRGTKFFADDDKHTQQQAVAKLQESHRKEIAEMKVDQSRTQKGIEVEYEKMISNLKADKAEAIEQRDGVINTLTAQLEPMLNKYAALRSKLTPKFILSCNSKISGCVKFNDNRSMKFFRLCVQTECATEIRNCVGHLTKIEKDGKVVFEDDSLDLPFAFADQPDSLAKTIFPNNPYYLDVLAFEFKFFKMWFAVKGGRLATDKFGNDIFEEKGEYILSVSVSGSDVPTQQVKLRFNWQRDIDTVIWETIESGGAKSDTEKLKKQLDKPSHGPLEYEVKLVLTYIFRHKKPCTVDHLFAIAFASNVPKHIVQQYCNTLLSRGFIEAASIRGLGNENEFIVTAKGRQFVFNMDK